MACSMSESWAVLRMAPIQVISLTVKRLFSLNGPLARDATHDGWTAHMFLYQNHMRNLVQKKNITGDPPAAGLLGVLGSRGSRSSKGVASIPRRPRIRRTPRTS